MIDDIVTAIREYYPKAYITEQSINSEAPSFPSISIVTENVTNIGAYSTFNKKRYAVEKTLYIEIYAKDYDECENISEIIDEILSEKYRYDNSLNQPIRNIDDTISRRVLRYNKNDIIRKEE